MTRRRWLGAMGGVLAVAPLAEAFAQDDATWRADLTKARIPSRPASGRLGGQPFRVDRATFNLRMGILTLQEGTGRARERSFMIFLFLPNGVAPDEKGYDIRPHYGQAPHIHVRPGSVGGP